MFFSTRILFNIAKTIPENNNIELVHHIPILANEITRILSPKDGQQFLDLTFGGGGHTKHLLATNKKITIFCLDRDPEAFQRAIILAKSLRQKNNGQRIVPLLGRFSELPELLNNWNISKNSFDGAIMDLGTSSFQLEDKKKGFSVQHDGPLDMRMDGERFLNMPTASDVINTLDADDLAKIFKQYGEEKYSKKISQAIVDARFMMKTLNTTCELATLVANVVGNNRTDRLGRRAHSATKVFQALRIFVNNELNEINYGIEIMSKYLKRTQSNDDSNNDNDILSDSIEKSDKKNEDGRTGGLLAVISFHSLEDRIVKNHFMGYGHSTNKFEMNTKFHLEESSENSLNKPKIWKFYQNNNIIYPSENEIFLNPKARSAKLRIGQLVL